MNLRQWDRKSSDSLATKSQLYALNLHSEQSIRLYGVIIKQQQTRDKTVII